MKLHVLLLIALFVLPVAGQQRFQPSIPKTWDDDALIQSQLPLAQPKYSPVQQPSTYYYKMTPRVIYKTYPIYHPDREPKDYLDWLKQQEPELAFDPAKLQTEQDWIRAGELVYDYSNAQPLDAPGVRRFRDRKWYADGAVPISKEGIFPFARYTVRKKGVVEITSGCGACHTRVMPDGSVVKGAQGNGVSGRIERANIPYFAPPSQETDRLWSMVFGAPWLDKDDPAQLRKRLTIEQEHAIGDTQPSSVFVRHGTSLFSPVRIPDLIGIKDRRYLDATGLVIHRSIGDLMRYGAMNIDMDFLATYDGWMPAPGLPAPEKRSRYSDEQLYALSLFIYSLQPPPNPNKPSSLSRQGEKVFQREGCPACHTPPLYTNNKLTPALGFSVPEEHKTKYDILAVSVGTDPTLALKTRRGTGYYKVPSLKGVWYRGPFEHNGSVITLEDWFDPSRLKDEYVPTGFRGLTKNRAVRGHEFGLKLSSKDKESLIAFLKTL